MAVAPPLSEYPWLPVLTRRAARVLTPAPGQAVAQAAAEFRAVAAVVSARLTITEPAEALS